MKSIAKQLRNFQNNNNYSIYLSFFRIFVCLYILKDICLSWGFIDLLYTGNSFLPATPSILLETLSISTDFLRENINYFLLFYITVTILFFFGIGKNFTALVVFLCFEINQRLCHITLNGGDNLLKFILLYLVFADCYRYFSVKPLQVKNESIKKLVNFSTNLAVLSICMHLCWVYFISALHKIHADVWFNGVATYYTMSLERFSGTPFNDILAKNALFVTISTYFTIVVEMFFPVLVWFRQTKYLVLIGGIMLHLGIFTFMMIYGFQLIFIATYGFFITDKEWRQFRSFLNNNVQKISSWLSINREAAL